MQSTDLTRLEAASYLQKKWGLSFTNGSLANMAVAKIGPTHYRRSGRTFYPTVGLDDFAKIRLAPLLKALIKHTGEIQR
jgi:hypothetical protein